MTNTQSKFLIPVNVDCMTFHHSWTDSCVNCTAGLVISSAIHSFRIYSLVYLASLLMRRRLPNLTDIKNTINGLLQSTAFLTTNGFTFGIYNCLLRYLLGNYYLTTVGFLPAFLASFTAIFVERPVRRPMLTLYVANLATETLWHMAEARGWVKSIAKGQVSVMAIGISILLYMYRLGLHKTECKDSIFGMLSTVIGKEEEGPLRSMESSNESVSRPTLNLTTITGLVAFYGRFIESLKGKHQSCPHKVNCINYAIIGGLKPFLGGVGIQFGLNILLNINKIIQLKFNWRKNLLNPNILNLGLCLGGFPFLYKLLSCTLRRIFGCDNPVYAFPAGLIASLAFYKYPNVTIALYVFWKMLQLVYRYAHHKGFVPHVPGFMILLYSFCTGILFHAGILEPLSLRSTYYTFLEAMSGERLSKFNLEAFDIYGLKTTKQTAEVLRKLGITRDTNIPKYSMVF